MTIDLHTFKSRFGRRVFLLFVLCALLPLTILTFLSFQKVTTELRSQRHELLADFSKNISMDILNRLLLAKKEWMLGLRPAALGKNVRNEADADGFEALLEHFVNVALIYEDGSAAVIKGRLSAIPPAAINSVPPSAAGRTTLITVPSQLMPRVSAVYFKDAIGSGQNAAGAYFIGEVDPLFLWGLDRQAGLPHDIELTVFDTDGRALLSSLQNPEFFINRLRSRPESDRREWMWRQDGERQLVAYRTLFLNNAFTETEWGVALCVNEAVALSSLRPFQTTFPLTVLLSFWIIMYLCVRFIRRNLQPLGQLKAATARVAAGDFDQQVDIQSRDEFEGVGCAFNIMTQHLGRQFAELKALAKIGHIGATAGDLRSFLDAGIKIFRGQLDYRRFRIWLCDPETGKHIYSGGYGFNAEEIHEFENRASVSPRCHYPEPSGKRLPDEDRQAVSGRAAISEICGIGETCIAPVDFKGRTLGALVAADPSDNRRLGAEDERLLGNLASQVALTFEKVTSLRQLQISEKRFKSAFDHTAVGMVLSDPEGTLLVVNRCFTAMIGRTEEALLGMKITGIMLPEDAETCRAAYQRILAKTDTHAWMEMRFLHCSGDIVWARISISALENSEGDPDSLIVHVQDITAQRKAENENAALECALTQAQKMEAIGNLAGGIAHDFNNILSAINGFTELALLNIEADHPVRNYLENVSTAGLRAADLVRQILTFSRKSDAKRVPVRLAAVVEEVMHLIRASLPATIDLRKSIEDPGGKILADPTQIHQILMNLCTNAHHAMKQEGGILEVSLKRKVLATPEKTQTGQLRAGEYLQLTVRDSGRGMEPDILSRIFEPYFTTKGKGEGTGLGLSVVHGIVKSHSGSIAVSSQPGEGTTFEILFPVAVNPGLSAPESSWDVVGTRGVRILLVDDEEMLVELATEILENHGHRVTGHTNPEAALADFRKSPDRFDVVITDFTMPGLTGEKLAEAVLSIRPRVPVFISSGGENLDTDRIQRMGIAGFIPKPITIKSLSKAITDLLETPPKNVAERSS